MLSGFELYPRWVPLTLSQRPPWGQKKLAVLEWPLEEIRLQFQKRPLRGKGRTTKLFHFQIFRLPNA